MSGAQQLAQERIDVVTPPHAPPTVTLRPYQAEAVDAIHAGLADGGRGQLHAACGAGKTLMAITAADRILPGDGLIAVFVPSLALVAQFISDWRTFSTVDSVLAVCSDDTVTDSSFHVDDVPADVTTSPQAITAWLTNARGRRLLVSTYISAYRVGEALHAIGATVDLAVFDEAHHLAGRQDFVTRRIVTDQAMPCRRRLFMTATPRVEDARTESTGLMSMDDPAVFGPVLYRYPWVRAIQDGYLDDYRIVVMGITEQQIMDLLADEEHEYVDRAGAPDLRTLAAQAVIGKAAAQYGLRRIIAFCTRLDVAREFASTMGSTIRRLPPADRPDGVLHAQRISGDMRHTQRQAALDRLRQPPEGGWTVLTNVRCLTEGLDVPAVDAVAFTHPKRSQVDIIQAVGRALRRSGGKQGTATIVVPIVVPDSTEEVGDLEPGDFRVLWQVVRALRAHDDTLGIELDAQRSHETSSNPQLPGRITIELPAGSSDTMLRQLRALVVKQTTSSWWHGYGWAREFAQQHGHLRVPITHVTEDGTQLGVWIQNARQHRRKGWLRPDRVVALDSIGMVWDVRTTGSMWTRFVAELAAFKKTHGHAAVPQKYISPSGYRLGSQVNSVRQAPHRVSTAVRAALDDIGMIWDTRDLRWQQLYSACVTFRREHGHLDVPADYTDISGYPLGVRLKKIRLKWKAGTLDPAEEKSLAELGFSFGDRKDQAWLDFLAACDRYCADHGDLSTVRKDYTDSGGYRLGAAISYYRNINNGTRSGTIPAPRRDALDKRGMVWRLVPDRDITAAEAETLTPLAGPELGRAIIDLIDSQAVTQSSIAAALGMHRSYLNTKIKQFREDGTWASRATRGKRATSS
ncbi:Helicase associated domain protein [Streptomyces sp. NPDC004031]